MAHIEEGLTSAHVALKGWRNVLLVVATISALATAAYTLGGLAATNDSMGGTVEPGSGDLPASCREAIVLPKRGWVCMEGMDERFDSSPGAAAADRQRFHLNLKPLKPHRVERRGISGTPAASIH
jgi:hypothetical protein